ncbi:MAG: hypothetical protein IJT94_12975, partial [Oscillibacter sp.]|nr:hypothetical protein [Oscillibacter sp.]
MIELKQKQDIRLVRKDADSGFTPVLNLTPTDSGFGRTNFAPSTRSAAVPVQSAAVPAASAAALSGGAALTSVSVQDAARTVFGTGASIAGTQGAAAALRTPARQLTSGASPGVILDVPAVLGAVNRRVTEAGTSLNHAALGRDFNTLLRAERGETYQVQALTDGRRPGPYGTATLSPVTVRYNANQASLEARANFPYMTEREKETALTKSGTELGAYIDSLDLTARRRSAEARERSRTAETLKQSTGRAAASENAQGRLIAALVTGQDCYALGKVPGIRPYDLPGAGCWDRHGAALV